MEETAQDLFRLLGVAPKEPPRAAPPPSVSPLLDLAPPPLPALVTAARAVAPPATLLAVFSPKGGVGKTTISVTLGAVLARRARRADGSPLRVCLVDLDLFGDVGSRLGRVSPTVLDLARAHPDPTPAQASSYLVDERASGLRLLLAPLRPDARNRTVLTTACYRRIVDALLAVHDVVILDCGTELVDPVLSSYAVPAADRLLFVVNNEAATLAAGRMALELLTGEPIAYPLERIELVLNQRADGVGLGDADVLARLRHLKRIGVRLPDDRQLFVGTANRGRPIVTSADPRVESGLRDLVRAAVDGVRLVDLDAQAQAVSPAVRRLRSAAPWARAGWWSRRPRPSG